MSTAPPALDDWDALSPMDVASLFDDYPGFWAIAGGWAIDLYLGRQTRDHADIDIEIDRRDASLLHRSLPGWRLFLAHGIVTPWNQGEPVPGEVSDIWCRRQDGPWRFQLLLGPFLGNEWIFRRNPKIGGPIESFTVDVDGLPVVAPEIQLLYKSNLPLLPKNLHDFTEMLPRLDDDRRHWLVRSLVTHYGEHPWLPALNDKPGGKGSS